MGSSHSYLVNLEDKTVTKIAKVDPTNAHSLQAAKETAKHHMHGVKHHSKET